MTAERTTELMDEGSEKLAANYQSKQDIVDWYCSTPVVPTEGFEKQTVIEKIKSVEKVKTYKTLVKMVRDVHDHSYQNE